MPDDFSSSPMCLLPSVCLNWNATSAQLCSEPTRYPPEHVKWNAPLVPRSNKRISQLLRNAPRKNTVRKQKHGNYTFSLLVSPLHCMCSSNYAVVTRVKTMIRSLCTYLLQVAGTNADATEQPCRFRVRLGNLTLNHIHSWHPLPSEATFHHIVARLPRNFTSSLP